MAGKYERFRLFGNRVPKYLMPLGKATILWHILHEHLISRSDINIFLVANDADRDFQPILASIMSDFNINVDNLIFISDTKSQLETALTICDRFETNFADNELPLAFANIDTIVKSRGTFYTKLASISEKQAVIDTFLGASHEYSYIRSEDKKQICAVSDGSRISENACSGLYGFGSSKFFCSEASDFIKKNQYANFTRFYQNLIDQKYVVFPSVNSRSKDTVVLGTPEEYISNVHRF
jgi:hypothetical protein